MMSIKMNFIIWSRCLQKDSKKMENTYFLPMSDACRKWRCMLRFLKVVCAGKRIKMENICGGYDGPRLFMQS